ncbi:hypothetical protein U9M48_012212 [Paspalum notatum var. saurae]|uniref:Reverse transcriptase domain-containing protein n=1 Tax=Paspalum notatum var. saurae TaxID=547442 RepID=A0AAQ3SX07_PASNO
MDLEPEEDGDKGKENNLEKDNTSSKNNAGVGKFAVLRKINEVTIPVNESASTPLPVPEPANTPTRKSKRNAATADHDSIEKAAKLKARKNLEESSLKGSSVSSNSKSGGMLVGVNLLTFDIGEIEEGDFFLKFKLRNKHDDFQWVLVSVYGAAQQHFKEAFLTELVQLCMKETLPILIGGDFNIIREPTEKNNANYSDRWPFLFNAIIDAFNLRKLELSGRQFTWANHLPVPTFEKLDRILSYTDWEMKFPRTSILALTREISDHTPLFLNTGEPSMTNTAPIRNDIPQVTDQENELLVAPFCEEEVRSAIFQMKRNTAPGPDGFPPEFYQVFWSVIKEDLMALFVYFHRGTLPLHSLNFGTIILLPKRSDARQIQQYKPICLLNVSFKIFSKVGTNRVVNIAQRTIKPSQSAFLPGSAVIVHETIHELHNRKKDGVMIKLDLKKAYDEVNWDFLRQTLRMKGFNPLWCKWVESFVQGGNVGIKVNDQLGNYFQTKKGLRQGDPISPILFNIVVDMLAILVARAKEDGQIKGVVPHLVDDGLSILPYADDTIIFIDHDIEQGKNMKLHLCVFKQLSGLKINFYKSEIFCFGKAKDCEIQYSQFFGCKIGTYPFRYLGISMHFRKLNNKDWKHIEDRFEKKLCGWKGKLLSVGGRLVLINSVLSSLPLFMLSFFEVPRKVLKKLEYLRLRFYWQNDEHKKKYRLLKWVTLCQPKDMGGLGIQNLDIQNKCLLSKWLFKLLNEDGLWQNLLRNKYLRNKTLSQVTKKAGDSHFWMGLMGIKDQFLDLGTFKLNSGTQIRFWEDVWLGNQSLKYFYPNLFNIVRKKHATMTEVLSTNPLNRALVGDKLLEWRTLVARLVHINLNEDNDVFIWGLQKHGSFSVKFMYLHLVNIGVKIIYREGIGVGIRLVVSVARLKPFITFSLSVSMPNSMVLQLFAGQFGSQGMRVFLTISNRNLFYRGTHWLRSWTALQRSEELKEQLIKACQSFESKAMEFFASHGWSFLFRVGQY